MFGYFRLFSIISLLVVVGLTGGAGIVFRNVATDDIITISEINNKAISESYIDFVWNKNREAVSIFKNNISEYDKNSQASMKMVQEFGKQTVQYFKNSPVLRVNIYNSVGTLLITNNVGSDNSLSIKDASPDYLFVKNNFHTEKAVSQKIANVQTKNQNKSTVLQTIIPVIINPEGQEPALEGVIELVVDLNQYIDSLGNVQLRSTLYIVLFFLLYLGILYIIARRIEAIISKQHETNVELASAVAMAQSENRDKSQFLANVSHELRTPLNAIIGFSEIIKNNSANGMESSKFEGYINDIHSSGVHLLSLINDILDYSKAEAGKLELEVAEANLNKLVHNCVRLVTPRAESAQVTLVEALPKESLNIITDSKKFKQILLNLLSNAIKFTPAGGEVRITAWSAIHDDTYMFEVKDSGIGIAPKDISRAMAPFGQVDSALSRKYEGTGLGLPLTKKFIELMGGKFEIESEVGIGTTIRFSIPREVKPHDNVVVKNAE